MTGEGGEVARSQAKIFVTIWANPDFIALTGAAQRLYFLLLTQSRLNLAGCLDYMPNRWATMAGDTSIGDVEKAVEELEGAAFVCIDRATDEVVVRTFTVHDLSTGTVNGNLVKGFWSAWEGILSPRLRCLVAQQLPERIWDLSNGSAPSEAERFRRSERLEPQFVPQFPPEAEPQSEPSFSFSVTYTDTDVAPTGSVPAVVDDESKAPSGRKRDLLFEAVADQCGVDLTCLTKSARGALNAAVKQLREVGVTPAEIPGRVATWHRVYPETALTPSALAKHWPQLDPAVAAMPQGPRRNGVAGRNRGVLDKARSR